MLIYIYTYIACSSDLPRSHRHSLRALQCVAHCCGVLQCSAVCCSVLQCVAVCCGVLQCVAECLSTFYSTSSIHDNCAQECPICAYTHTHTHIHIHTYTYTYLDACTTNVTRYALYIYACIHILGSIHEKCDQACPICTYIYTHIGYSIYRYKGTPYTHLRYSWVQLYIHTLGIPYKNIKEHHIHI